MVQVFFLNPEVVFKSKKVLIIKDKNSTVREEENNLKSIFSQMNVVRINYHQILIKFEKIQKIMR